MKVGDKILAYHDSGACLVGRVVEIPRVPDGFACKAEMPGGFCMTFSSTGEEWSFFHGWRLAFPVCSSEDVT